MVIANTLDKSFGVIKSFSLNVSSTEKTISHANTEGRHPLRAESRARH